jgi:hypothetical protein
VARALWRRDALTAGELAGLHDLPPATRAARRPQPAPYFAVDTPHIRYVGIDTGITGRIDARQREWLRRVSTESPAPKVLLTGKPLYVNGALDERTKDVDEIVRDPESNYVAAIGGDTHNYQRYSLDVGGGRVIHYIVSGGGGAFMHATHIIPRVAVAGVGEDDFRCYPIRADSLAFYSRLYGRRLRLRRLFELTPEQASAVIAQRLGIAPTRPTEAPVTLRTRFVATALGVARSPHHKARLRLPVRKTYTKVLSPGAATYSPPFFKSFLRLDVTPGSVRVRAYAATGMREQELDPPVEDDFTITLPPDPA